MSTRDVVASIFVFILVAGASLMCFMLRGWLKDTRELWREGRKVDAMMGAFISFVFAYVIFSMVFYAVFLVRLVLQ